MCLQGSYEWKSCMKKWCAHGRASWGKNYKNGRRKKIIIGPKWNMMWSISCAFMLSAKAQNPYKKNTGCIEFYWLWTNYGKMFPWTPWPNCLNGLDVILVIVD
jgi:hypothetical protein